MAGARHRHMKLLEEPSVRAWYDQVSLGSVRTAKNYLRMLGLFCERTKTTPDGFLRMPAEKQVEMLREYVQRHRDRNGARPATKVVKKALVSWVKSNGKDARLLTDNVSTRGSHVARRDQTDLPTRSDLRRALLAATPQVRAMIGMLAFAGQRIEVLGTRLEEGGQSIADGLRFSDFPEARFEGGKLIFDRRPAVFYVRSTLDKLHRKNGYFAFLGPEGCDYLEAYVAARAKQGEKVTRRSPVIAPQVGYGGRYEFIHPNNIGEAIRNVLRAVGIMTRPYDLRHYFSQNAELGVKDGLNVDWKEYWMGHAPKVKQLYSLRDAKQLMEPMRDAYAALLKHVETTVAVDIAPTQVEVFKSILSALYDEDELAEMSDEQIIAAGQEAIRKLTQQPMERVVELGDLEAALGDGWSTKLALPNGNVVVMKAAALVASEKAGDAPPPLIGKSGPRPAVSGV